MTVTPATLQTRYPRTFGSVPDAVLQPHIDAADGQVRSDLPCRDEAVMFLAAHNALGDARAYAGTLSNASAGPVSVGYATGGSGQEGRSAFLAEYERIIHAVEMPFVPMGC